ncbi:MAG: RsmB/NOP family class I SAM-dependent RNA methyltransferase, partial [Nanoarchaeota archaeon]
MKHNYEMKPLFVERMKELLGKENFGRYKKSVETREQRSIRVNTLKISVADLKKRLENKNWIIKQPFKENPEIFVIENELLPGELGRALEHLLGYYYAQEIASMLPALVLNPKPNEIVLDLCSSPGSKTTQMASMMKNTGTIIANEVKLDRIKILASNLERCGVTNTIITRKDGVALCERLKRKNITFDKILVDAPCSGEGTIRSSPKTLLMWNINTIKTLSKLQKKLLESAIEILKPKGEIVYSTCTHAPEENEAVLDYVLNKFEGEIKIEKINLPVKCSPGILGWAG